MTEPTTAEAERPVAPITFLGREMYVHMPSPEQILVWRRTLKRLEAADPESWTAIEVMDTLERFRSILDSLLVSTKDIDWFDDEMLAGRVDLQAMTPIVPMAIDAFTQLNGNRATKRAAAKAPTAPARRKPAAPRTRKAT